MQLISLLIVFLGVNLSRGEMLSNASVSTMEDFTFNNVYDLKMDRDDKSLFVLDRHALWRVDLSWCTRKQVLIAGGDSPGYVEGVGKAARFNKPQGLAISNNKAIICDSYNHCLREVNVFSGQTTHVSGTCTTSGFKNGPAVPAQYNHPTGLVVYKSGVLVADQSNQAVRFLKGGIVSTIASGFPLTTPRYLAEMRGEIFLTTKSALLKVNVESKSVKLISGHESNQGDAEGSLLSARFSNPLGVTSLSPGILLISDYNNQKMKFVDVDGNKVLSICTGAAGTVDGNGNVCQLDKPWPVTTVGKNVYIGQNNGKIRIAPLESALQHMEDCPPSTVRATVDSGEKFAEVHVRDYSLSLEVGEFEFVSFLSDGSRCITTITVT